jgi:hypothetical protein
MAHGKMADMVDQQGTPFPAAAAGDNHVLIPNSRKKVDNGVGMDGVFASLVADGFAV